MSSKAEVLVNPATGVKEQTWTGFSWPCLFLGVIWFLYKQLWGWSAITLILAIMTGGLAWLAFPFFANKIHREALQKAGWTTAERAAYGTASPDTHVKCPDCRELVLKEARKCKHCGTALVPQ